MINILYYYRNLKMSLFKTCGAMISLLSKSTPRIIYSNPEIARCSVVPMKTMLLNSASEIHTAAFRDGCNLLDSNNIELYPMKNGNISISSNYISVRHKGKKGKWAVSPTKSGRSGRPKGKSRGLKVYDGQRVPGGTLLVNQMRPVVFPGWNVSTKFTTLNNNLGKLEGFFWGCSPIFN